MYTHTVGARAGGGVAWSATDVTLVHSTIVRFAVRVGACWICRATFTVGVTFVGADAAVARVVTVVVSTFVTCTTGNVVADTGAFTVGVTFVGADAAVARVVTVVVSTFVTCTGLVVADTGAFTVGVACLGADAAVARVVAVVVSTFVTCTTGNVVADTGKR